MVSQHAKLPQKKRNNDTAKKDDALNATKLDTWLANALSRGKARRTNHSNAHPSSQALLGDSALETINALETLKTDVHSLGLRAPDLHI
jgi:glycerol kinase